VRRRRKRRRGTVVGEPIIITASHVFENC